MKVELPEQSVWEVRKATTSRFSTNGAQVWSFDIWMGMEAIMRIRKRDG